MYRNRIRQYLDFDSAEEETPLQETPPENSDRARLRAEKRWEGMSRWKKILVSFAAIPLVPVLITIWLFLVILLCAGLLVVSPFVLVRIGLWK